MAKKIPYLLPQVMRAHVERGDIIVIEYPGALPLQLRQRYQRELKQLWPRNKVLILEDGATLKIGTQTEE